MNVKGILVAIIIAISIGIVAVNLTQFSNVDYYTVDAWYDPDFKRILVNVHFVSDTGDFVKTDGSMKVNIHQKTDDLRFVSEDISFTQEDFMTYQNEYGAKLTGLQIPIDRAITRHAQYYVEIDSLQLFDGSKWDNQVAYFDVNYWQ